MSDHPDDPQPEEQHRDADRDRTDDQRPDTRPEGQHPDTDRAGAVETTGDADIDAALAELDSVRGQPLEAHIAAAERVRQHLQSRLSDLGDS